jgi:hypothetical protein
MTDHQVRSYGPDVTADDRSDSTPPAAHDARPHYEIRVQGRIGSRWSAWFDGMTVTTQQDGTTLIEGQVADQSALFGLLLKMRDMGLPLLSVIRADRQELPLP